MTFANVLPPFTHALHALPAQQRLRCTMSCPTRLAQQVLGALELSGSRGALESRTANMWLSSYTSPHF